MILVCFHLRKVIEPKNTKTAEMSGLHVNNICNRLRSHFIPMSPVRQCFGQQFSVFEVTILQRTTISYNYSPIR